MSTSFTLDPRQPIGDEVRRVALAQVAKMNRALEHPKRLGIEESVHDVRKRAKKLRALARLVRPGLRGSYKSTNAAFRDAAGELSGTRDTHVLLATLDVLTRGSAEPSGTPDVFGTADVPEASRAPDAAGTQDVPDIPDVTAARAELVAQAERITKTLRRDGDALASARALVALGADLVGCWQIEDDFEVLAGGIAATFERLGRAFGRCRSDSSAAAFHEWRKCAKYHRYHLELLCGAYPPMIEPWIAEMRRLTDALGEDHDLAVFSSSVEANPELFGGRDTADALIVLAERRSAELRGRALSLGARLAVEDPRCVADRLGSWWNAARSQG